MSTPPSQADDGFSTDGNYCDDDSHVFDILYKHFGCNNGTNESSSAQQQAPTLQFEQPRPQEVMMMKEASEEDLIIIASSDILETDVLFGRGRHANHPGNLRYRVFLDAHNMEVFENNNIPRQSRTDACIRYTQELISSYGTRFLMMRQTTTYSETDDDDLLWVACDFNQAVDKVSQYFRTRRRMMKKKRLREQAGFNP